MTINSCTHEVNSTSIQINWTNSYPDCFKFSVSVDGMEVQNEITNNNYTIRDLVSSTTYNVCVVAQDGHGNTRSDWMHCDNITTNASTTGVGMHRELIHVCGQ